VCGYRQVPLTLFTDEAGQRRLVTLAEAPADLAIQCHERLDQLYAC